MRKLRITKNDSLGYDLEYITKPSLFIKGVGRRCPVCGRHIVGRSDKKTCSRRCTSRIDYIKNKERWTANANSIKARISIKKEEDKNEYRILSLYMKRGVTHKIKITPKYSELWEFLEKLHKFRNSPIEVISR